MVFNIALNHLQQREEAEEVTQDVFVKVHGKLAGFSGRSNIRTWIYRITVNQCLDHLKARKRKKRSGFHLRFFGDDERDPTATLSDYDHPGVMLEDREAVHALFTLIDTLPTRQRSILILKAVDGLEQQEIAAILELSVKSVESLLSRAKDNLKQKMMDNEGTAPGTSSKQRSS